MRAVLYPKLAWEGIRKNKRLYLPYLLTGGFMVMMHYIMNFLAETPELATIRGGSVLMSCLPLGCNVIAIFSLLFLFYTNSFLVRQRYREFGLYNILGMDKKNISKIMIWENLFVAVISIVSGLAVGVVLSKAAELVLLNLIGGEVSFDLSIGMGALEGALLIYGSIYLLLLCNSLIKVGHSKPLELMKSSQVGEKIPKRTWIYALIGTGLLGTAYYLAVSIQNPVAAVNVFFFAVIMVILATYLLFMSGSVVFCKLLQKNKKYYYHPHHFVSVSSMVYRMKRNGAGLASICILLTMVLVMISATASLYFGEESVLPSKYPDGVNITTTFDYPEGISNENLELLRSRVREWSGGQADLTGFRAGEIPGLFTEEGITVGMDSDMDLTIFSYDNIGYLSVVSLEDYNRMSGTSEVLAEDECMLYCRRIEYRSDTFAMEDGRPYKVKKVLDDFLAFGKMDVSIMPSVCIVVNDLEDFIEPVQNLKNSMGDSMVMFEWRCGFDLDSPEAEIAAADAIEEEFRALENEGKCSIYSQSVESREWNRKDFYLTFGSLFFLGIMLSIVFLLAAVLIIYYKQISEGYEDQARFDIMQKVGMTKKDIRRSINSQILTVFFSPLLLAGIHLAFAFPFLWKFLLMFGLYNTTHAIIVTIICFILFGLFYGLVYKITSSSYYSIVSGRKI